MRQHTKSMFCIFWRQRFYPSEFEHKVYFSLLAALHLSPSVGIPGHLLMNITSLLVAAAQENWEIPVLSFIKNTYSHWSAKYLVDLLEVKGTKVITVPTFNGSYGGRILLKCRGDPGLIPGLKIYPREGNGYPVHYSCLKNYMDRAWYTIVHGVYSWTQLRTKHAYLNIFNFAEGCCIFYATVMVAKMISDTILGNLCHAFNIVCCY